MLQSCISILTVLVVASACYLASGWTGFRVVALILLVTTSIIAMLFDFIPVLIAAILSAVIWNFFFIPPIFTFHIDQAEDLLMFSMYFVIALVHAVLMFEIRKAEKRARDKDEKDGQLQLYNTLFNSLSHELRTPISTILGAVDALRDPGGQLSESVRQTLLEEIDIAAIRLNRQVENLLNLSRLESGLLRIKPDWCDINELVQTVLQKLPPDRVHAIRYEPSGKLPLFQLDAGWIEQVLQNLLFNALQYSPGEATIRIIAAYRQGHCILRVSDKGPGFPEKEMARVFDKFYRLPGSAAGGIGLGLSIVKGFVEAHHGTVVLQNNPDGGATFLIDIPTETSFINQLKNE